MIRRLQQSQLPCPALVLAQQPGHCRLRQGLVAGREVKEAKEAGQDTREAKQAKKDKQAKEAKEEGKE